MSQPIQDAGTCWRRGSAGSAAPVAILQRFAGGRGGTGLASVVACGLLGVGLGGCFPATAAKQVLYEIRGAQAKVRPIRQASLVEMSRYRWIEFDPSTTSVGPRICPAALLRAYDREVIEQREKRREIFPGGEPSLRVTTDFLLCQEKGLLSGALCLARVRGADEDREVVDLLVQAESKSFRSGDEEALGSACAEAVVDYLAGKRPPADD